MRSEKPGLSQNVFIILTTAPPGEAAERIARSLLETRLAACIQILPAGRSFYCWEGAMQENEESTLVIKTSPTCLEKTVQKVRELHPYDVPEILTLGTHCPTEEYTAWVNAASNQDSVA